VMRLSLLLLCAALLIPLGMTPPAVAQSQVFRLQPLAQGQSLAEARTGFQTRLLTQSRDGNAPEQPPSGVLELVHYAAPSGRLAAYVTPRPAAGGRHPAIIWMTGGDSNSIGDVWSGRDPANDQTAAAFREAGIVMIYPSLRGGNDNPGYREGFLGEVDDVLAAADYLASLDYVDPERIYLGGHSTGGTLVMLVAAMSNRFRATFAFGPVEDVRLYGGDFVYGDMNDPREVRLRSPVYWLDSVRRPLLVFEGNGQGNIGSLETIQRLNRNPQISFHMVPGRDHFSALAPVTTLLAKRIVDGAPFTWTPLELATGGRQGVRP
jgi:dipeptidyl aminopeptidase/acylaminoacyl peptidase